MPLFLSKGSSSSSYNSLRYSWSEVVQGLCQTCKHSENSQRDQKTLRTTRIVLPSPSWWLVSFMISGWSWSKCCYNVICTIQVTKKVTRVICLPLQPFCWNLDFHFVQLISHAILPQFWVADNQGVSKGHNNKRSSPRESSNQEKKIATAAAAAAATLGTFSNSVSNLLMMTMMMMIFSTSVVQNLAGNNRYSCQRFSSSVCSSDADPQEAFPIEEKKRRSDEERVERVWNNTRLQIECRRRWGSLPLRRLSSSSSSSSSGF